MGIEFNEDGSIKIPEMIKQNKKKRERELKLAEENPEKVIIDYEEETLGHEDKWFIVLPESIPKTLLFKMKKWADYRHEIESGSAWIEQDDNNEFVLTVKGRKNRCTWAHAFLNGLNTALIKDYKTKIKQKSTCKHKFYVKYTEKKEES